MDFDPRDNDDARDDQRWGYERDDRERDLGSVREASGDSRDDSLEHLREEGLIRSLTRSSKPTSAGRAKLQHDAQLFRAYLEIERPLREKGAEISRVVIETDLKREYRQFLQEHNRGRPEHTVITELAEMGVADHVLESISGHLSRRMLEHYSHIRIDAKRQALDALDNLRRSGDATNGNESRQTTAKSRRPWGVPDDLTSQSRHSLLLQGSPPSGKLLIPLERRDVRVVEGARLEIALAICDGVLQISITVAKSIT